MESGPTIKFSELKINWSAVSKWIESPRKSGVGFTEGYSAVGSEGALVDGAAASEFRSGGPSAPASPGPGSGEPSRMGRNRL